MEVVDNTGEKVANDGCLSGDGDGVIGGWRLRKERGRVVGVGDV